MVDWNVCGIWNEKMARAFKVAREGILHRNW